jgi:uncharacterized membrane protein
VSDRTKLLLGLAAVVVGITVSLLAAFAVHATEAADVDAVGRELYSWAPRGWIATTIAQSVSLGGVLLAMGGLTLAFLWQRRLTWARAALGAVLFVGLLTIIFGIIPNQFLTLTQSTLEWTPQRIFLTIPPFLVLGNEVAISYAALKDILLQGFVGTMLIGIPVFMYKWQERAKRADQPRPQLVSDYGRPLRVER